jgi:hypothetical protein
LKPNPKPSPVSIFIPKISIFVKPKESNSHIQTTPPVPSAKPKMSNGVNIPKISPNGVILPKISQGILNIPKMSPGVLITPKISINASPIKNEKPMKSPMISPGVSTIIPKISSGKSHVQPIKSASSIVGPGVKFPIESAHPVQIPKGSIQPIVNSNPSPMPMNQHISPRPLKPVNPQVSAGSNQINAHTSPKKSIQPNTVPNGVISPKISPLNQLPSNPTHKTSPIPSIGSNTVKDPITTKPKDPTGTTIVKEPQNQTPISGNSPSPIISVNVSSRSKNSPIVASSGNHLSLSLGFLIVVLSIFFIIK